MEKIDTYHRKHLREILGITWNDKISNEELYTKADVSKLTHRISKSRWRMLGRVLRQPEQNPARSSLLFAIKSEKQVKGRRGRPRINLYSEILKDLNQANINIEDNEHTDYARDKTIWWQHFLHI